MVNKDIKKILEINMIKINEIKNFLNKIKIISLNKKLRLFSIMFLYIALIAAVCFLYITMKNKYIDEKYNAYTYSHNAKINYSISLLPNNLYTQPILGEDGIYISSLVNSINSRMKYEFIGDQAAKIQGKYSTALLFQGFIKNDNGEKILFEKKNILQPEKKFNVNNKKVFLTSTTDLSIKSYNEMVRSAIDSLKVNFTAKLTVIWSITVNAKAVSGTVNETIESKMEIPINEKYFEIGGNLNNGKKGEITAIKKVLSPHYNERTTATYIGGIFCLLLLIFIQFFTSSLPEMNALEKKTRQIFKNHADRLVATTCDGFSDNKEKVNVLIIEDLVRIADDLGRPILYKISDKNKEITDYIVLGENTIYMLDIRTSISDAPSKNFSPKVIDKPSFEE